MQVDAVSGTLASAHLPLVLLCSGALLAAPRPKVLQVRALLLFLSSSVGSASLV
jgi:hypothetical protein